MSAIAEQNVLYLDTGSSRLMLAISQGGEFTARRDLQCESHRYHSALMIPAIQEMLSACGLTVADLEAIALNLGPGSFTGLRTGIITARTMGQFLNVPIYGFNWFELLTANCTEPTAVYLDALRDRAYHAALQWQPEGPVYVSAPRLVSELFSQTGLYPGNTIISPSLKAKWPDALAIGVPESFFSPLAMFQLLQRYGERFGLPWEQVLPFYLQEPSITLRKPS